MTAPLDHLLVDYVDDPTTARTDVLDEALAADPTLAERLVADSRMHRLLQSELAPIALTQQVLDGIRQHERSFTAQVMTGLRQQAGPQHRARRAIRWFPCALAAGLRAAVLVTLLSEQGSAASMIRTSGTTLVIHGTSTRALPDGSLIPVGAILVGADGQVASRLIWPDGSRIQLRGGSRVRCASPPSGPQVHLLSGELDAEITAQHPDRPFRILTNDCNVTVIGTELTVHANPVTTWPCAAARCRCPRHAAASP
jgi:FecR protein